MGIDWFNVAWEIFPYLFVSFLVVLGYGYISKRITNHQRTKRLKKGKDAEKDAQKLLIKSGYKIEDYQPHLDYTFKANADKIEVNITPDFIVSRSGKHFVVEVKSGEVASQVNYSSTRRQILEYSLTSKMPLLFVDMERKEIFEVEFPFVAQSSSINWWKWLSVFLITALSVVVVMMAVSALLK